MTPMFIALGEDDDLVSCKRNGQLPFQIWTEGMFLKPFSSGLSGF